MSEDGRMLLIRDAKEFSVEVAEFIALEVGLGATVKELHEHHGDRVPHPIVVNRWRRDVPAFDLLMQEAEAAKADCLVDELIGIADDSERQAAQARNAITTRQWLAGRLNGKYGDKREGAGGAVGGVVINNQLRLTDEQLMAIASGKFEGKVIEGEVSDE